VCGEKHKYDTKMKCGDVQLCICNKTVKKNFWKHPIVNWPNHILWLTDMLNHKRVFLYEALAFILRHLTSPWWRKSDCGVGHI